jgi:Protein of unknown function (DUF2752)
MLAVRHRDPLNARSFRGVGRGLGVPDSGAVLDPRWADPGSCAAIGPGIVCGEGEIQMACDTPISRTAGRQFRWHRASWSTSLLRAATGSAAAVVAAHLSIPGRPATLCPLRALTGIPCPICGTTTAAVKLGHLDFTAALLANPFTVLGAIAVVVAPAVVAKRRSRGLLALSPHIRRRIAAGCVVVAAVSEIWQLFRFNII